MVAGMTRECGAVWLRDASGFRGSGSLAGAGLLGCALIAGALWSRCFGALAASVDARAGEPVRYGVLAVRETGSKLASAAGENPPRGRPSTDIGET